MTMRYNLLFLPVLCFMLCFTGGCGYHIGVRGMMHPQIKTVAIAPIQNNTLEPLVSDVLRMQLAGEFQRDGALKLKNLATADCVVYAVITEVQNRTVEDASFDGGVTFRPAKFQLTVQVSFKVVIPGSGNMLVKNGSARGSAIYEILSDQATARSSALKFACFHVAQKMVSQTTEAW